MKSAALISAVFGIIAGLLSWALGLWYISTLPISKVTGPMTLGTMLLATHVLNTRKLRNPTSRVPRRLLIGINALLFALCALGLWYLVQNSQHGVLFLGAFGVLFVLPLAVNALYFAASHSRSTGISDGC